MAKYILALASLAVVTVWLGASEPALAADLNPTITKALEAMHLNSAILKGVDRELAVPQTWVDGAKKEGEVRVEMNVDPREFATIIKAFRERYPFVKVDYKEDVGRNRALVPLIAFKEGKYVTDIVYGFQGFYEQFANAHALADLRPLPAFASIEDDFKDPTGLSAGYSVAYWCLVYNTARVKEQEIPKTWEGLATSKRFANGKVGMLNKPYLWTINLWGIYGNAWLDKFMNGIFHKLKPQLRSGSMSALIQLAGLGEFDIGIPAYPEAVAFQASRGAKVGFYCPSPVPVSFNPIGILKGNPHPNASRVFVNWLLSKEGQIILRYAANVVPSNKGLQGREFLDYPDTILGKKKAPLTLRIIHARPMLEKRWNKLWAAAGGP